MAVPRDPIAGSLSARLIRPQRRRSRTGSTFQVYAHLLGLLLFVPTQALFGGHKLEVRYGENAADGNLMTDTATATEPRMFFGSAQEGARYTVIMADPDAPSPADPTCKWYLHWIRQNASGVNLTGPSSACIRIDQRKFSRIERKGLAAVDTLQ